MTYPIKQLKPGIWWPGVLTLEPVPVFPRVAVEAQFSGSGTFVPTVTSVFPAFSGEGMLGAVAIPSAQTAVFAGEGTLSATMGATVDAEFSGDGGLSATVTSQRGATNGQRAQDPGTAP